jgi:hypothetical protein
VEFHLAMTLDQKLEQMMKTMLVLKLDQSLERNLAMTLDQKLEQMMETMLVLPWWIPLVRM